MGDFGVIDFRPVVKALIVGFLFSGMTETRRCMEKMDILWRGKTSSCGGGARP